MVANFDSMEQLKQWMRIAGDCKISSNGLTKAKKLSQPHSLTTGLWAQSDFENNCENLLNTYPEFASCFAGIIRTAYLYAPKIVVTVADLFDGVFFVALGPKAVNGILGTSYKDGAKLVVSGVKDTLAESLISFIAGGKKNNETGKLENIGTSEKTYCILDGRLIGLPGLKRASLGWGTHLYARVLDSDESRLSDLVQSQGKVKASSKSISQALVRALVRTLRKQESFKPSQSGVSEQEWDELSSGTTQALSWFEFLARRWQEWLEAERRGEIVYRKQEGPAFQKEFARVIESEPVQAAAKGFVYDENSYEAVGQRVLGLVESGKDDQKVTDTIASYESADRRAAAARFVVETNMCRRSDALEFFKDIYERFGDSGKEDHRRLEGWYEYIYQKSMADRIGRPKEQAFETAGSESDIETIKPSGSVGGSGTSLRDGDNNADNHVFDKSYCNLIYVSNKSREEQSDKENTSDRQKRMSTNYGDSPQKDASVIMYGAKGSLKPGKKRRKNSEYADTDTDRSDEGTEYTDSDRIDQQIYVDNCFLERVRKLAKGTDNDEVGKADDDGNIHTLFGPVTDTLRHMPHSRFQTFCYESRGAIARWRANGSSVKNTRDMGYCILQSSSQQTLSSQRKGLLEDTAVALFLAAVAVAIDLVLPNNALPLVVMVILSWMISAIPSFINLYRWGKEVKSSGETVLIDG